MAVGEPAGELLGENRYIKGRYLGEGQYGVVFKATDIVTNRTVAVKKFKKENYAEDFIVTALNVTNLSEIKLLKELHDPNIIQLLDVFPHNGTHHLVFEFMETDLNAVIQDRNINLSPADYKSYMQMTLEGLAVCHKKGILHRDLKPSNLLLGSNGQLKLADFGLARHFGRPNDQFTPREVCTLWYRAPELLFGCKQYGPHVDVWAAACIFAELILRTPFLMGKNDIDQLHVIFEAFGTPSKALWPDLPTLPNYVTFKYCSPQSFRELFPQASADCLDLLQQMFAYNPEQRITAQHALEHRYFRTAPTATPAHMLRRHLKREATPKVASKVLTLETKESRFSAATKTERPRQPTEDTRTVIEAIRDVHAKQELRKPIKAEGKATTTVEGVIIQDAHAQRQLEHAPRKAPRKGRLMRKSRVEYYKSIGETCEAPRARERRNTKHATPISKSTSGSPQQQRNRIVDAHRAEVIPPKELKRKRHDQVVKEKRKYKEGDEKGSSEETIVQEMVPSPPSVDDSVEFEVNEVLHSRFIKGKLEYYVHWKGYSVDESTWEPAENLENAQEKVAAFHKKKPIQAEGMRRLLKRLNPALQSPRWPQ